MLLLGIHKTSLRFLYFAIATCCISLATADLGAADLKPEEIVAKHLDSIGSAEARAKVKSRVIQGGLTYRILVGGSGVVPGKFQFASEAPKTDLLMKINANGYLGEWFICDGDKTSAAATYPDKTRSEFGNFVLSQDMILRENLLGGVWSTGWPLLDLEAHKPKLHAEGLKKVDGKELLAIRYEPKRRTDLEITLYFDPQTYQHVMTVYEMEPPNSLAGGETRQAGKQPRRYRLEEHFSDFKTVDGLTLPTHYDLRFTLGYVKSVEWEVDQPSIANNMSIDPRTFQVR
ncbi:MAG: hypothetical protein WA213_14325 [Terriglobales bacterium]